MIKVEQSVWCARACVHFLAGAVNSGNVRRTFDRNFLSITALKKFITHTSAFQSISKVIDETQPRGLRNYVIYGSIEQSVSRVCVCVCVCVCVNCVCPRSQR